MATVFQAHLQTLRIGVRLRDVHQDVLEAMLEQEKRLTPDERRRITQALEWLTRAHRLLEDAPA